MFIGKGSGFYVSHAFILKLDQRNNATSDEFDIGPHFVLVHLVYLHGMAAGLDTDAFFKKIFRLARPDRNRVLSTA